MEQINDVMNRKIYRYLNVRKIQSPQPFPNGSISGEASDLVTK
jgi:hypothetical protein